MGSGGAVGSGVGATVGSGAPVGLGVCVGCGVPVGSGVAVAPRLITTPGWSPMAGDSVVGRVENMPGGGVGEGARPRSAAPQPITASRASAPAANIKSAPTPLCPVSGLPNLSVLTIRASTASYSHLWICNRIHAGVCAASSRSNTGSPSSPTASPFTYRISGSRCQLRFLVGDGAAMMVASTMVPYRSITGRP